MAAVEEQTILSIDVIRTDGGTQPRVMLNQEVIHDYAQQMFEGAQFKPVTVYYDGTDYWLADGFHRYHAAKQQCKDIIYADVRQGTRRDAVLFSVGANATHGLRRSNEDKRKAVETLLRDPEWTKWPQTKIAQYCNVSREYVSRLSSEVSCDRSQDTERLVERNGKVYPMNTTNIGSQPSLSEYEASLAGYRGYDKWQEAQKWEDKRRELEPDTEPELPDYTPPRYEAPTWTPTIPPSPTPTPAPMPASHYSTYTDEDEETEEEHHQTAVDIRAFTAIDTGALIDYYDELVRDREGREIKRTGGVPPALQMSESNEWYTPAIYVDAARELMGGIDVDPASNPYANEKVVHATTYYDIQTNGLDKDWTGRVWLNPPYGRESGDSNQEIWTRRLVAQFDASITTEAVILVNAVTDRKWFQPLWRFHICFTNHRIRFYNTETEAGQPTHGNALIYLGPQVDRFIDIFEQFGPVVRRVRWQQEQ